MISEYLKRCQELAEKKSIDPMVGTVHTSPAYRKLLEHALRLEREQIPEELFDGYSVLHNVTIDAKPYLTAQNVSDVLGAVVRMIRERIKNV